MTLPTPSRPTRWAHALGYGGLIPFVGLASAVWVLNPVDRAHSVFALLAYGATILSFLGAIHWGLAMRDGATPSTGLLVWGVLPSLLAWLALLVDPVLGVWLIAAGLCACFLVDRKVYPGFGLGAWLPMRLRLTVVAGLCCLAGASRYVLNA